MRFAFLFAASAHLLVAPTCGTTSPEVLCAPTDCGNAEQDGSYECADGSIGGFTGQCVSQAGVCAWEERKCPEPTARVCGVRGAEACAEGEFCLFEQAAQCGAADVPGVCTAVPDICPRDFFPVCGCDGVTYGNACGAFAGATSVVHAGACEDDSNGATAN